MMMRMVAVLALAGVASTGGALAQGRECGRMHRDYDQAAGPKAWAAGSDACGYATARSAVSLNDAKRRAMMECMNIAGRDGGCRVLEAER